MISDESRISSLEKENEIRNQQLTAVFYKLDSAIEKIQDLALNLTKIVTQHDAKLQSQERSAKDISKIIESQKVEHIREMKEIHDKIYTNKQDVIEKIEASEKRILAALSNDRDENDEKYHDVDTRLKSIEKWKYAVVGSATVLGFLLSKIIDFIFTKL